MLKYALKTNEKQIFLNQLTKVDNYTIVPTKYSRSQDCWKNCGNQPIPFIK